MVAPDIRPSVAHPAFAASQDKAAAELVMAHVEAFEASVWPDLRDRCNRLYEQYRGFRKFKDSWIQAGRNDKDGLLYDAKKQWGAHLHIPLSFRTIETMVPAAIAQRPRLMYLPRRSEFADNIANVRLLVDSQQDQIDIDLAFQAVMRSGRIYGLGIGKTFWRTEYATQRRMQRRTLRLPGQSQYVLGAREKVKTFDDPDFEDVDIFSFGWDPYGSAMAGSNRCRWAYQRLWFTLEDCLARVQSGAWNTDSAKALTEDELRRMGGDRSRYDEMWQSRMAASGFGNSHFNTRGEQIHELIEWHDGNQVLSVLNRAVLVQNAENPCLGHLPFSVYRPTPLQYQMVGIGDLEPIEHLQRELDTLRSQRRDAATLVLAAPFIYDSAAIDEDDLVFAPNAAIEVRNARPSDALMRLEVGQVPGSSYQDEQVIRQDFDVVSGINDALNPQEGPAASTATEAQLIQASLSRRIEMGSRRFEIEVVRQVARTFLYLDQRMISEERPTMVPPQGMSYDQAAQQGRWEEFPLGPGELAGEFLIVPEGGSMAARNVPQDRQDAMQIMQLFGQHPNVEPIRPLERALELFAVQDPKGWLKQAEPPVPPLALKMLQDAGVPPELIQQAVANAQRQDPQLAQQQQGPGVPQVDQAMGAGQ